MNCCRRESPSLPSDKSSGRLRCCAVRRRGQRVKYVEWVEHIARTFSSVDRQSGNPVRGVHIDKLAEHLMLSRDDVVDECIVNAMGDLSGLGLADSSTSTLGRNWRWRPTQEGLKLREISLRESWPQLFGLFLTDEQSQFLRAVCDLSEECFDKRIRTKWVETDQVTEQLGLDWGDPAIKVSIHRMATSLQGLGLVQDQRTMGGPFPIRATYAGVVRATQLEPSQDRELLHSLLDDGETSNVDFKRELHLDRDREKAEFVRDILGLANTRLSGRRFLVIGIDDNGIEYASADATITSSRIEQILNSWVKPVPLVRTRRILWNTDQLLLIEIIREPATPTEEDMIRMEGERARGDA